MADSHPGLGKHRPPAWGPSRAGREVRSATLRGPAAQRVTALDILAFLAGVLVILVFSQGWLTAIAGDKATTADSGLIRAMFFPAYAAAIGLVVLSPGETVRAWLRQPLLIALMWIAALSVIWSVSPDQTLRRVVALVFTTMGGVVLGVRWRWAGLAEVIATAFAILAVGSFASGLLLPGFGRMQELFPGAWRGLWVEKNTLASNMTIGFMVCAAAAILRPGRALLWSLSAALCLLLVLLSTSKTSLVACLLGGCGLVLVAIMRRGPLGRLLGTYGAITAIVLLGMGLLVASDVFLAVLGKDATLTGRTKIWAAVMRQIQERPWQGYGYFAVWSDDSPWAPLARIIKQAGFKPEHAHNSWLEQWLGIGVFGLGAWALYFVEVWTRALIALYRSAGAYLAIPVLLVYSMTTLTESIALVFNDARWAIFIAIAVRLATPEQPPPPTATRPIFTRRANLSQGGPRIGPGPRSDPPFPAARQATGPTGLSLT